MALTPTTSLNIFVIPFTCIFQLSLPFFFCFGQLIKAAAACNVRGSVGMQRRDFHSVAFVATIEHEELFFVPAPQYHSFGQMETAEQVRSLVPFCAVHTAKYVTIVGAVKVEGRRSRHSENHLSLVCCSLSGTP